MPDKWEIIAQRKREGKLKRSQVGRADWQRWRPCELCGTSYCCNNYEDQRTRITRWKGIEVCAVCKHNVLKGVRKLMDRGVLKFTKEYR